MYPSMYYTGLCFDVSNTKGYGVSGGADDKVQMWRLDYLKVTLTQHNFVI